ncbi:MAG: hypothetical protein HFF02_05400, partial [Erysipelotrichaceae bacterium]|nr:hypothetical protein [Erysipelotrichaceae bacterium]
MWKKIMIVCMTLLGTLSIGYAYYQTALHAAVNTYRSGGEIAGRVHQAPSNITGSHIGMQKGDKFHIGAINPKDGSPLGFMVILKNENYNDYISPADAGTVQYGDDLTGWFSMTTESIAEVKPVDSPSAFTEYSVGSYYFASYNSTNIKGPIDQLTNSFLLTPKGSLLLPRDIKDIRLTYQNSPSYNSCGGDILTKTYEMGNVFFPLTSFNYVGMGAASGYDTSYTGRLSSSDLTFSSDYWTPVSYYRSDYNYVFEYFIGSSGQQGMAAASYTVVKSVRPSAFFDLNKVVFGVSKGTSNQIGKVKEFTSSGGSLWNETSSNSHMKLRFLNSQMQASLFKIQNEQNVDVSKVVENSKVHLIADANQGKDANGNPYTLSVIVFDKDNHFKYYQPLENAKGSDIYEFDTTGIIPGNYKIAVVNEAYHEIDNESIDSSLISNALDLEIVEPHKLTYTKQPQSGATSGNDYEFSKNVNAGQV